MKVDTKKIARKLILIAAAQYLMGCKFEPKHFEKLTQKDRMELARLLNRE